jgi:hypothetical protein
LAALYFGLPELVGMLQLSMFEVAEWTQQL